MIVSFFHDGVGKIGGNRNYGLFLRRSLGG